jgi:transcriptional regulator GlxA family with amidase domain
MHRLLRSWSLAFSLLTLNLAPVVAEDLAPAKEKPRTRTLGIVFYDKFEVLDAYGPIEMFGNVGQQLKLVTVAENAGPVESTQKVQTVAEYSFDNCPPLDLVLVPGGIGTLKQLKNEALLDWLRKQSQDAELIMSVCSGSAILAKAGLLDGKKATCNKNSFALLTGGSPQVDWQKQARWVDQGNIVTSSGVSAGTDMALHVIERLWGTKLAEAIADGTEYEWHRDADWDPFAAK